MADPCDHRVAERVDAAAVVQEVDAERLAVAIERGPETVRATRPSAETRRRAASRPSCGFECRRAAPSVDDELDVAPGGAFRRRLPIRAQRFEIRALRRNERQRSIVEHHADDDAADDPAAIADAAAGAQHVALARFQTARPRRTAAPRCIPWVDHAWWRTPARGRTGSPGGRRRHTAPPRTSIGRRPVGPRPDDKRSIGGRRRHGAEDEFGERRNRVDLLDRFLQPPLAVLHAGWQPAVRTAWRPGVPWPRSSESRATDTSRRPARAGQERTHPNAPSATRGESGRSRG